MRPRLPGCLVGALVAGGLFVLGVVVLLPDTPDEPRPEPRPSSPLVTERRLDERRMELTIRSAALGATTKVRLLLPRGWESRTGWPVLWLLHGGLDDQTSWTAKTDVEALTRDSGVLVVMPDGGKCGGYSDWWNGGAGGPPRWETYHLKELLPLLESRYRAGDRRAVAGYSMGGQGAMLYAAKGRFEAAASFSGAVHILAPGVPQAVMAGTTIGCFGTDWKRVWGDPEEQRDVWRAHNPYDLADRLEGVDLYVAAGEGDLVEDLANRAARAFTGRLKELDIPVRTHFYRGGHNHTYWQRELHRAYPMLMKAIGVS
ncbi:S-formylglutathione hydrolase FrmB [Nonomuraea solani]|uniref:S-formylglutathione hydrolase FrmB n=1 Tax=Nonomuraea solani TaxID=1144553 RepID=A0A1H5YKZ2_9ACTN|nr:alpha/beta hydrolase family protein [Nonomuraea solani]SEG24312.1 S-formylglutathione hydrolase FrmB [Nonomuraea solani]